MIDLAVLVSGRGTNLQALLDAIDRQRLDARVIAVISNRPEAPALDRARRAGIDTVVLDQQSYPDRAAFDDSLQTVLEGLAPDWIVLAGFMRVLGPALVQRFVGRMLNIHPSLLPAYPGLNTHARVLQAGERHHGASVHFVSSAVDGGPIIAQTKIEVRADDTPEILAQRLLPLEHRLLCSVVALCARQSVELRDEKIYINGRTVDRPAVLGARPGDLFDAGNADRADRP